MYESTKELGSYNVLLETYFQGVVYFYNPYERVMQLVYVIAWFGVKFGINHTSNVPRI